MASIRVFSGGAPKEVFLKLTPQFEKANGHKVTYVFEVMSSLKDRLAKGEVADVLVMPTNMLDSYEKDGVVRAHGRAILGLVPINAVVRSGAPLPDLSSREATTQSLLKARSISHATPGATPSGTHMGKLVEQLGIADAMKSKTIHRPALEGGVELVARGEAEIGFYPKSEVINIDGLTLAGPLPADIQLTTIYGAGVTAKSAAPDAAEAFIRFMTEGQVQPAWRHAGFDKAN